MIFYQSIHITQAYSQSYLLLSEAEAVTTTQSDGYLNTVADRVKMEANVNQAILFIDF